jgi:hypothetical protein
MVAAEVVVALLGAPRNGQAGDDRAWKPLLFVAPQNGGTDPRQPARVCGVRWCWFDALLPISPLGDVRVTTLLETVEEAGTRSMTGLDGRLSILPVAPVEREQYG